MTRVLFLSGGAAIPPEVADSLRADGLAIFPTDTLYGMGVDPRSAKGLARLMAVKGREPGKPVPLLLDDASKAGMWAAGITDEARLLMDRFWPGALTLVLPAAAGLPAPVAGEGGWVGLRVPGHPAARALAASIGGAITGTSANRAGEPGVWPSAEALAVEFDGEADWILWDGPSGGGAGGVHGHSGPAGSTVVRVSGGAVSCIREGAIPFRTINEFLQGRT